MRSWTNPLRLGGIIVALALSLVLGGCSAIKLGYNTLPEWLYWWLDGYADFSDAQEPLVRGEIARLHRWHRQEELPQVAELLARMEQLAPGEITPQQACGIVADAQARMQAALDAIGPEIGVVAVTFDEKQLRHMERKFRRNNEKFRDQPQDKRYEDMLDRLETVYGHLDAPQRAVLRESLAESSYDRARILADRQRRQQDLLQVLRQAGRAHLPPDEARAQLRAWADRAMHAPDPVYRAWQEGLVQEGCRIFAAVHHATTPAQREHAVRRLRAYQRDLRELSAQPQ